MLSEYIWQDTNPTGTPNGVQGGPSCLDCITKEGFTVVPGSQVLYALGNPAANQVRVGFGSAGAPNTVTEAVNSGSGWQIAVLPN